jgi:flagellar biosynthesis anti-sigma factor FlgM
MQVRNGMAAGQPLRSELLSAPWAVQQGQSVRLLTSGAGFTISNEGKALNNAGEGQLVRVRTASGQVVSGVARVAGSSKCRIEAAPGAFARTKSVKVPVLLADRWIEYNRSKGTTVKIDSTTSSCQPCQRDAPSRRHRPAKDRCAAQVHLSPLAAQLQTSGDAPAFDANKVSQIRQAIAEGRFTINAVGHCRPADRLRQRTRPLPEAGLE